jgi:predicted alpha-1,6-mannanase (GH76 family)
MPLLTRAVRAAVLCAVLAAGVLVVSGSPAAAVPECPPSCDGADPATAQGDSRPVPDAPAAGRIVTLHISDPDDLGWASIAQAVPGDEVWLDRTFDGGFNWDGKVGAVTLAAGQQTARTLMYQLDDKPRHGIGALRACGRSATTGDIGCTAWARSRWNAGTRIAAAATALTAFYDFHSGVWPNIGWWNTANAVTALIDYYDRTGSVAYRYVIARTYNLNRTAELGDFRAKYIDDTGWWGLAWVRAYDLTGEPQYLRSAQIAADYMASYWDARCGGGVWWDAARTYKNAITNELYLKLVAALHNRTPGETANLARAAAAWNWFKASGMVNADHLVNDGISTATCRNNGGRTWTYNQGVILGALTELHRATGDPALLGEATAIATAATTSPSLVVAGVLTEPCRICGGPDQPSFKGAFVRNLGELDRALSGRPYRGFLQAQVASLWAADRTSLDQYGLNWAGPLANLDAATQHSALDAYTAALP